MAGLWGSTPKLEAKRVGVPIRTLLPNTEPFDESVSVIGIASPRKLTTVHSLLEGKIASCSKREGDTVQKGEVVCSLDSTVVDLELARARNAIASTERAIDPEFLEKQRKLFEAGVIGQIDFEKIRLEAERAHALLSEARNALSMVQKKKELHHIIAPFQGRIIELKAQAGLPIAPSVPAAVLTTEGGMVLKSEVPAKYFSKVRAGAPIRYLSVAGEPLEKNCCENVLTAKSSVIQMEKQTFLVESPIQIDQVAPGILVRSEIVLKRSESSVTIPFGSIVEWSSETKEGKIFVFDLDSRSAVLRRVKTSDPKSDKVNVLEGLKSMEEVVFPIPSTLTHGVAVVKEEGP